MMLATEKAAGINGLTCLSKYGGAQDNKFLVTHPMNDLTLLNFRNRTPSALEAELSSFSKN
jgi:hypothetical protein